MANDWRKVFPIKNFICIKNALFYCYENNEEGTCVKSIKNDSINNNLNIALFKNIEKKIILLLPKD